jgi:hypothetical protein
MKKSLCVAALSLSATAASAADVGVSITLGQPGFYGQIDIGAVPQPQLVYPQPVVIQRSPEYVSAQPIYLHVPPGHEKHWSKHCAEYHACGRPVYFVRDDWYNNEYVSHYHHGDRDHGDDHGHGHGRGHDKDHGHDDHGHDDHGHDDHGHDEGHHDRDR